MSSPTLERQLFQLHAPAHGRVRALAEHHCTVLASGLLGNGVCLTVHGHQLCSPCAGHLVDVSPSGHAWLIECSATTLVRLQFDGPEYTTTPIGIRAYARRGTKVNVGDPIAELHLPTLKRGLMHTDLAVVSTMFSADQLNWQALSVRAGEVVMHQELTN